MSAAGFQFSVTSPIFPRQCGCTTNAMEDLDVGDEGYNDEDLDALPDHAFEELQENAVRSTQHPATQVQLPPLGQPANSRAHMIAGSLGRYPMGDSTTNAPDQRIPLQPSSDYGDFDDEMLDGEIFDGAEDPALAAKYEFASAAAPHGESTQREQWRQQRYGQPPSNVGVSGHRQLERSQADRNLPTITANEAIGKRNFVSGDSSFRANNRNTTEPPLNNGPADVDALQAQVQKLLSERELLQQSVQSANNSAYAKAGEIAIVRANATKVEKEYEARTNALQKLHADEAARQKIEVEKARAELQKIATEKDFLENDLAQGTKQIRNLQKAIKKGERVTGKENQPTTPKKSKSLPLRDGFDDDEVLPMSPSKLALRSKGGTPKAGVKRKRKAPEDSPVKPLELAQPQHVESFEEVDHGRSHAEPCSVTQIARRLDQRFQLTQRLLNHRFSPDEPRIFERLSAFEFPTQPDKHLSTILLDETSILTSKPDAESFPSAIGLILISMWARCMEENFHQPVHLLVELVNIILVLNPIKTAPDLTNDLMSLVQLTADVVLVPRCQKKPPRKDRAEIDSTECLQIMQMMAYDCQCDDEEISRFWRTMRFDFIMMLLNFINPLQEIHLMLSLLHTSILENSFAMIVPPNNGQQDASEAHIIDNLSHLLINIPRPPAGEDPPDAAALCELRLEVLGLMKAMCDETHSAESLAKHRLVIGCLVRVMNDELDRVYDHHYGHELRIELVNESTRLLYHLTANYPHLIDMQAKLNVVPGGEKKFLIALTRLAFSEGGFYEQGIKDDVVDCAHQMLEARVSPEEAEGLVEAFSSAPVSRK